MEPVTLHPVDPARLKRHAKRLRDRLADAVALHRSPEAIRRLERLLQECWRRLADTTGRRP